MANRYDQFIGGEGPPPQDDAQPRVDAPSRANRYDQYVGGDAPVDIPPTRSWWDTAQSVGQTADDAVRAAANAISFGMADRLAGMTSEGGTDEQVRLSKEARERSPYASIGGDVGGAVMLPGVGGRQLAARYGGGWLARALGFGAEGAGYGALQGAGNTYTGKPLDYITNAGTGGAMGGILGAGMGAAFGPRGGMRSSAETPSTDRLFQEKNANYRDLGTSGALYEANALARAATPTEAVLRAERFHPNDSPRSFQAIDEMRAPPTTEHLGLGAPVSPGDIEYIRKGLNQINPVTGGTDLASARYVKRALDNFVLNPPPGAVLPGTEAAAREASAIAERARGNYAGYKRGQLFDDMVENATTSAGSANSGLNVQNTLRQGVKSGLRQTKGESPFSRAGYNDDEIEALTRFARVPFADASLRYVDRVLGGGGGLGAVATAGVGGGALGQYFKDDPALGSTLGLTLPVAGLGLRLLGNRRATQNMSELGEMIRQRTPLFQERSATAPMVTPGGGAEVQGARDAVTLEMMKQLQQE